MTGVRGDPCPDTVKMTGQAGIPRRVSRSPSVSVVAAVALCFAVECS